VWHVAADPGASGWGPHRDGNLGDGTLDDGQDGLITVWIPLTEATPANGCMYVLPTDRDPLVPESLKVYGVARSDLAGVRSLPAAPGDVLGWNTRLLHWGGRSSVDAVAPRMSMSIYCQRRSAPRSNDDFVALDGAIPLRHRLGVISRAMLTYENSKLSGTALPAGVAAFAHEQRERLAVWLAMTAQLDSEA
jgi:ectoine hydroxylase-related dioxygenase (phytanoyl-CoA dioxygenase family)